VPDAYLVETAFGVLVGRLSWTVLHRQEIDLLAVLSLRTGAMNLNDALALRLTKHFVQDTRLLEEAQAIIDEHARTLLGSPDKKEVIRRAVALMGMIANVRSSDRVAMVFTQEDRETARLFLAEFEGKPGCP
jgi:hypothetical protein